MEMVFMGFVIVRPNNIIEIVAGSFLSRKLVFTFCVTFSPIPCQVGTIDFQDINGIRKTMFAYKPATSLLATTVISNSFQPMTQPITWTAKGWVEVKSSDQLWSSHRVVNAQKWQGLIRFSQGRWRRKCLRKIKNQWVIQLVFRHTGLIGRIGPFGIFACFLTIIRMNFCLVPFSDVAFLWWNLSRRWLSEI